MGNRLSALTRKTLNKLVNNSQTTVHAIAALSLVFASTFGMIPYGSVQASDTEDLVISKITPESGDKVDADGDIEVSADITDEDDDPIGKQYVNFYIEGENASADRFAGPGELSENDETISYTFDDVEESGSSQIEPGDKFDFTVEVVGYSDSDDISETEKNIQYGEAEDNNKNTPSIEIDEEGTDVPNKVNVDEDFNVTVKALPAGPGESDDWESLQFKLGGSDEECIDDIDYSGKGTTKTFPLDGIDSTGEYDAELIAFRKTGCNGDGVNKSEPYEWDLEVEEAETNPDEGEDDPDNDNTAPVIDELLVDGEEYDEDTPLNGEVDFEFNFEDDDLARAYIEYQEMDENNKWQKRHYDVYDNEPNPTFTVDTAQWSDDTAHRLKLTQLEDQAGNKAPTETFALNIDNTAPEAELEIPENDFYSSESFMQEWNSDDDDVAYYNYRSCETDPEENSCDDDVYDVYNLNANSRLVNLNSSNDNTSFWWQVQAVDEAGNVGDWTDARKATFDTIDPIIEGLNDDTVTVLTHTLSATIDEKNDYEIDWGKTDWPNEVDENDITISNPTSVLASESKFDETVDIEVPEYGDYEFQLTVTDEAGNEGSETAEIKFEDPDKNSDGNGEDGSNGDDNEGAPTSPVTPTGEFLSPNQELDGQEDEGDEGEDEEDGDALSTATPPEAGNDDGEVAAETDTNLFNWLWILLLIALVAAGYYYYRRRQSSTAQ